MMIAGLINATNVKTQSLFSKNYPLQKDSLCSKSDDISGKMQLTVLVKNNWRMY